MKVFHIDPCFEIFINSGKFSVQVKFYSYLWTSKMVAVVVKKVIEYMDCHKISSDPLRYSIVVKYFN